MPAKSKLVIDAYNVIEGLRGLGVRIEESAALGCCSEGDPARKVTPELVATWFGEKELAR